MIYLIYGQPASGKTTLGQMLAEHLGTPFVIDGDEFREMFTNKNYGRVGREENIKNANAVATYLNKKGERDDWSAIYYKGQDGNSIQGRPVKKSTDVVMCLVNPYKHLREELTKNNAGQVVTILLTSQRQMRKEYQVSDFENGTPNIELATDQDSNSTFQNLLIGLLAISEKNKHLDGCGYDD
tara:strand:- start:1045 stop:1593 length:549 start_codon:yes stop_codon:yes gene_type:complete